MYIQGFSHWSEWGESPPPPSKNLLIPTHLEKFPPSRLPPPPPTKQQFSSYNLIKTTFLAVAIALAPFLS